MKKALAVLFIFVFFFQYSLLPALCKCSFSGLGMVTVFVVALCLRDSFERSLLWSFSLGLFVDYFSTTPFGTYALIFILIAGIIELYKTKLTQSKKKRLITFFSILFFLIFTDVLSMAVIQTSVFWGGTADFSFLENFSVSKYIITRLVFSLAGVGISFLIGRIFDIFGMYSRDIKI